MKKHLSISCNTATLHSSLAITTVAMALTMNACQDYDYGFTEEEIHNSAVLRHYDEAFHKQFPQIDPHHTWMYDAVPTFVTDNGSAATRAAMATEPIIIKDYANVKDSMLRIDANLVDDILNYMTEKGDNLSKITKSFEYLAVTETTYDIWPVLWGEKFCKDNYIGIYVVNEDGSIKDLGTLWSDTYENVLMGYEDHTEKIRNSERALNIDFRGGYGTTTTPKLTYNGSQVSPQYYLFPHYKVTMPAGTLWGIFLRTHKDQSNQNDGRGYNDGMVTWCSNPAHSFETGKYQFDKEVKSTIAAGTFTFGGVTYCCFEDAPLNISNNKGQIYRSYDHDYNDFMLQITPRPIESTYQSSEVRVMCEDLGGTFDWDFNDIVYDIKFVQGAHEKENANITITLQAVGGTLPIHMVIDGEDLGELHEIYAQESAEEGLYEPINVGKGRSVNKPKLLKTIDLGKERMPDDYDFREIVRKINLVVCEDHYSTRATRGGSESITSDVVESSHVINFPDKGGDKAPQCFMTSIGTEWPTECVNIADKYSEFNDWVMNQGRSTEDWWSRKQF